MNSLVKITPSKANTYADLYVAAWRKWRDAGVEEYMKKVEAHAASRTRFQNFMYGKIDVERARMRARDWAPRYFVDAAVNIALSTEETPRAIFIDTKVWANITHATFDKPYDPDDHIPQVCMPL